MSPIKQRIKIAEACGWKEMPTGGLWKFKDTNDYVVCDDKLAYCVQLPDYLNDLNVMNDAEKILNDEQYCLFSFLLFKACFRSRRYQSATAAQRAEAFLKTLGLWEE